MVLQRLLISLGCLGLILGGCSSEETPPKPPASQPIAAEPATRPAEPPQPPPEPEPSPILPESEGWSREQALAKLADEATRLSAAVRLVRLAEIAPLCVPDPLPPRVARRLRVVPLSDSLWALGWATTQENRLRLPVLIDATGAVTLPAEGAEEEAGVLCCSEDTDVFPHLLITPGHVTIVGDELRSALVAKSPTGLSFDLRFEDDWPYVALLWRAVTTTQSQPTTSQPAQVARYKWDPWELAFMGALCDELPTPPGGLFELDLEQSAALIPVGGVIPEPPPIQPPEPAEEEPPPF
jgi:hypothetical protein